MYKRIRDVIKSKGHFWSVAKVVECVISGYVTWNLNPSCTLSIKESFKFSKCKDHYWKWKLGEKKFSISLI